MQTYKSGLLARVRQHLKKGGVIAYPTESCFGFGCDPFNYQAIQRVIRLKGRSKSKGLIVIAGAMQQLIKLLSTLGPAQKQELSQYWPGFYSILLAVAKNVPPNLIGKNPKIAVRVSQHPLVAQLCHYLNLPLVSTSANKSGFRPISNYRECQRQFGTKVLILPGQTSFAKRQSTIIDWETKKILR